MVRQPVDRLGGMAYVVPDGREIAGHRVTARELGTPTECTASPSNRRRKMADSRDLRGHRLGGCDPVRAGGAGGVGDTVGVGSGRAICTQ